MIQTLQPSTYAPGPMGHPLRAYIIYFGLEGESRESVAEYFSAFSANLKPSGRKLKPSSQKCARAFFSVRSRLNFVSAALYLASAPLVCAITRPAELAVASALRCTEKQPLFRLIISVLRKQKEKPKKSNQKKIKRKNNCRI